LTKGPALRELDDFSLEAVNCVRVGRDDLDVIDSIHQVPSAPRYAIE
jgi:hypothetical protein